MLFLLLRGLCAQPLVMNPKEALVPCGQTVQFQVASQDPKSFRWHVDRGKIDETGLFTAPSEFGVCHISATEWQDVNRSAQAEVRAVEIRLTSRQELFLKPGEEGRIEVQLDFRGGEMDRKLLWTFGNRDFGGEEVGVVKPRAHDGRVDATGWVRAPSEEGSYPVRISLASDPRIGTTTQVRVIRPRPGRINPDGRPVSVVVRPEKSETSAGLFTWLNASVSGSELEQVIWSLMEGATDGELSQSGEFRASRPGTYRVRVTSFAYPECWGEAEVVVKPSINAALKEEEVPREDRIGMTLVPAPGGYILLGGWNGHLAIAEVQYLDLAAKTLLPRMALQVPRARCLAARLTDGTLLVVGGIGGTGKQPVRETERVDIDRKVSWRVGLPRWFHIGGILQSLPSGRALLVGGIEPGGEPCGAEVFDSVTATFKTLDERPWPLHAAAVALRDGGILMLGGELNRQPLALMWRFDPAKNTFSPIGKLFQARSRCTATQQVDEREVAVIGGRGAQGVLATVERVDVAKGSSSPGGRMAAPRERHAALLLPTGQTQVFGGGEGLRASRLIELWSPDENAASTFDQMDMGVWMPALHLNPDGSAFVFGVPDTALAKVPLPPIWNLWD